MERIHDLRGMNFFETGNEIPRRAYLDSLPDDPKAIFANQEHFGLNGDGESDDSKALQSAIDAAAGENRYGGIVFLPSGKYRIHETLNLWAGVRIISVGKTRPQFILKSGTETFKGKERKYLLHFRHFRENPEEDANNSTFFSALMGIDFIIEPGFENAAALRYRVAQHGLLRQCDFFLSDDTYAAVDQAGHIIEECRFFGGRFGVTSLRTSASWPLCIRKCLFQSQGEAAMATSQAGLTVLNSLIRNVPTAFCSAPEEKEDIERLYVRECRIEGVSSVIRRHSIYAIEQQLTVEHCQLENCGSMADFEDYSEKLSNNSVLVEKWSSGISVDLQKPQGSVDACGHFKKCSQLVATGGSDKIKLPPDDPTAICLLHPVVDWVNIKTLMENSESNFSATMQRAMKEGCCIYFPTGVYEISDTITIGKNCHLLGLHPGRTTFDLPDNTEGFEKVEAAKGILETQSDAAPCICGLGFRVRHNPGACGIIWRSKAESLLEDIYFHSPFRHRDLKRERCHHSIWITENGAGELRNIWSADVVAESGLSVENTKGPLKCIMLSVEHHREHEVRICSAQNVTFIALQTEENSISPKTVALILENASNIRFNNTFLYRVMAHENTVPQAILGSNLSEVIFQNLHVFSWGQFPFASACYLKDTDMWIRQRELTRMALGE